MQSKAIGLLALALMLFSGCSSLPPAWRPHPISNGSGLHNKATIVVPVQGAAISLQNSQIGTVALFGIVGVAFRENLIDKPNRESLLAKTGDHLSVFSPDVVLAEECVLLLNQSRVSSRENAILFSGLKKMPGLAPEIASEPYPFRVTFSALRTWQSAYNDWLIGPPIHNFSTDEAGSRQLVSLEVTTVLPLLRGKDLSFGVLMRLMDPNSGQSIASGFCRRDNMTVHPFKSAADFDAFVADYRKCARQIAESLLKQLNLIP